MREREGVHERWAREEAVYSVVEPKREIEVTTNLLRLGAHHLDQGEDKLPNTCLPFHYYSTSIPNRSSAELLLIGILFHYLRLNL
jgi:hypothetical protein